MLRRHESPRESVCPCRQFDIELLVSTVGKEIERRAHEHFPREVLVSGEAIRMGLEFSHVLAGLVGVRRISGTVSVRDYLPPWQSRARRVPRIRIGSHAGICDHLLEEG